MYITPTDVKHSLFCPAVVAAKRIGHGEPPAEYLAERGELPRGLAEQFVEVRAEVPLERPPLRGVVDYLARDRGGSLVPIEVKAPTGPATSADVYQLAAYMWMAEAAGPVKYGLLVKDRTYRVANTPELRESLLHIVREVVKIYRGGDPPYVTDRCHICSYSRYCLYRKQERR
ncbi:MAG: CRISPR-associated protein Cas4 [Pyrobaculum sp.]